MFGQSHSAPCISDTLRQGQGPLQAQMQAHVAKPKLPSCRPKLTCEAETLQHIGLPQMCLDLLN